VGTGESLCGFLNGFRIMLSPPRPREGGKTPQKVRAISPCVGRRGVVSVTSGENGAAVGFGYVCAALTYCSQLPLQKETNTLKGCHFALVLCYRYFFPAQSVAHTQYYHRRCYVNTVRKQPQRKSSRLPLKGFTWRC
jgi:hypothetical protein